MKTVVALLAAVCVAVVTATLLGLAEKAIGPSAATIALVLGVAAGIVCWRVTPSDAPVRSPGVWGWGVIVLFACFALREFLWLVWVAGTEIKFLLPNNLGDLSLHLTYINHLASGARFWPDNPIFPGQNVHYPLGVDLFNSLLVVEGRDIYRSLVWVGLGGAALCGWTLYRWGGAFGLAGFLMNGGIAGFAFFYTREFENYQADLAWKSLPLAMLVTQRSLLYALPAGLALLISWRSRFFGQGAWQMPRAIEWLLYASMPLFHVHTFLFLSFMLGLWAVTPLCDSRREVVKTVAWAFVPASLLVWLVTGFSGASSVIHLEPWWKQGGKGFFMFWFLNFGILPFLIAALVFRIAKRRLRVAACFVLPALIIFALCSFVMFARWDWDNIKLLSWSYLVVLPFLWDDLIGQWHFPTRLICCVALFGSGFISLLGGLDSKGYKLADRFELAGVEQATQFLDPDAVYAAQSTFNHPLLLIGRKVAMGYEGHLWSHGIDYAGRKRVLDALMNGQAGWEGIAQRLSIRYIYWGPREEEAYPDSQKPWSDREPIVEGKWGAIYEASPEAEGVLSGDVSPGTPSER